MKNTVQNGYLSNWSYFLFYFFGGLRRDLFLTKEKKLPGVKLKHENIRLALVNQQSKKHRSLRRGFGARVHNSHYAKQSENGWRLKKDLEKKNKTK